MIESNTGIGAIGIAAIGINCNGHHNGHAPLSGVGGTGKCESI